MPLVLTSLEGGHTDADAGTDITHTHTYTHRQTHTHTYTCTHTHTSRTRSISRNQVCVQRVPGLKIQRVTEITPDWTIVF